MREIVLTEAEANEILAILSDIPIRYLNIVQGVQRILANKFQLLEEITDALSDK